MRTLLCLAVLLLSASTLSHAQTIEFDPPSQIEVVPDQLAVTFKAGVAEATARTLVTDLGYEVVVAQFTPVVVQAAAAKSIPEARLQWLREQAGVQAVTAVPRPDDVQSTRPVATTPMHVYSITLAPETTEAAARKLVEQLAEGVVVQQVTKRSNDLTIRIPAGEDELAITQLEARPEVDYVVYVAAMQ